MCQIYTREWEDKKTIGIYGRFMKGKKRYFIRLLQSFPKTETEKTINAYIDYWKARRGLTYEEIGYIMVGIRQPKTIAYMLGDEEEANSD